MLDTPFEGCSYKEALRLATEVEEESLFESAAKIREHFFCNSIQLCMIINAKCGKCSMDCTFCSQSMHHGANSDIYPLFQPSQLAEQIKNLSENGIHHCGIVASGDRLKSQEVDSICQALLMTKNSISFNVCASLGRLSNEDIKKLKKVGLVRYHHNLETSERHYPSICSTQTWQERLSTVKRAIESGLEVCAGGLFGLGETWEDRIDLAIALRDLGVNSVPINFLHPQPGTPLENKPLMPAEEALRIIAVYRHLLPNTTLRICGGRPGVLKERQKDMFRAGANALMTGNYLTTSGQIPESDVQMIKALGLKIA
ncbi:MAG: biotin synthase BioB [Deltaproteobacteria bacterium]|nr:biotin synthase BioB [Deltaproteobacteria bacterium]MBW1846298.1 biotin synthase BioB [Deltaproteobacteria bacterium]MBW2180380.1 biotin synthase BioB [Deltaproteobacteria bacterium]